MQQAPKWYFFTWFCQRLAFQAHCTVKPMSSPSLDARRQFARTMRKRRCSVKSSTTWYVRFIGIRKWAFIWLILDLRRRENIHDYWRATLEHLLRLTVKKQCDKKTTQKIKWFNSVGPFITQWDAAWRCRCCFLFVFYLIEKMSVEFDELVLNGRKYTLWSLFSSLFVSESTPLILSWTNVTWQNTKRHIYFYFGIAWLNYCQWCGQTWALEDVGVICLHSSLPLHSGSEKVCKTGKILPGQIQILWTILVRNNVLENKIQSIDMF